MEEETERTFDLSCDLLIRAKLFIKEKQKHYFVLVIHHIVSDGWSISIFEKELSKLYQAFLNEEPSPLFDPPVQYADFSTWQRHWLQGEVLEKQLSFWKTQLDKAPQSLELPTDRPRPVNQSLRGESCFLTIPKQLTKALNDLSMREGCTLFMTMLSAFKILLYRLSGQDDILVGTPVAGRNRIEVEGLIGFFINTLILRSDLSSNPDFSKLLTQVREVTLDAYAHQDISFEKLVEELHPPHDLTRPPFFQVFINMLNVEAGQLNLSGLTVELLSLDKVESKFDLTLYIREFNENIQLNLVYRTELFSKERMDAFIRQYRFLLEQIVEEPGKQICNYSLVTPESLSLLPNPKEVISEPRQELVSNMLFSWVRQTPEKTALTIGRHTWCYSELGECVENLAKELVSMEVKKGEVVAITGQKSFGLIVSILSTMLSSGVILLIDNNLPEQRKRFMISDANARRVIYVGEITSEDRWIDKIPEIDIFHVEALTGKPVETEKYKRGKSVSLPVVTPDDAAYIFFTSGTTGKPKGILGYHKGLSHFLAWQRDEYAVGPEDKVAQLTNLSFDVVLRDIFLPLTSGGTLCVPENIQDTTPDRILSWLEHENITILHLVPSIANVWLDALPQGVSLKNLRCVFFAGEPLSEELVLRWRNAFPDSGELVNLYGPTETTLAKSYYKVPQNVDAGIQSIGQPLPDTQALVISRDNVLCGIGETGEIVIRTPFRTEGYINENEENKSRFVKNPYRNDDEDLLYYTGDLGRYRPDGSLDILGRLDSQVKILGVRVELEEVSVALSKHPSVKSCVVIAGNHKDNQKCLIGYVVLLNGLMESAQDIRSFLGRNLPDTMVPSIIIFLDSIPLTPNGKLDRNALPAPDQKQPEFDKEFVAPCTSTEIKLSEIWCILLKLKKVGVNDNFFELGGHSLLATRLISMIVDAFQVELPLRVVFENPIIAEIALQIDQIRERTGEDEELGRLLDELEELSDEETQKRLTEN
jgi:amino acid adenylation domain-containing protein